MLRINNFDTDNFVKLSRLNALEIKKSTRRRQVDFYILCGFSEDGDSSDDADKDD